MKKSYYQLFAVSCLLLMAAVAFAQPGASDINFGKNGKITVVEPGHTIQTIIPGGVSPVAVEMKVQPDQKILVLAMVDSIMHYFNGIERNGYLYYLYRLQPNGTYDSSFGTNGRTAIVNNERPASMELLPGGKILVSSQVAVKIDSLSKGINFCLSRYNVNGTLDNSFGTAGKTVTTFDSCRYAIPTSLFVLANGKIIQAGCGADSATYLTLARFNANGTIDAAYGTNGKVALRTKLDPALATRGQVYGLAGVYMLKQSNDKIVAAYNEASLWPQNLSFTRFAANGRLDSTFGTNGVLKQPNPYQYQILGATTQPDDKMVIVTNLLQTLRFKADGSRDSSFSSQSLLVYSQFVSPLGAKIIVEPNKKLSILYGENNGHAYLAKLNPDGTPDMTFGKRGLRDFPIYLWDFPPNAFGLPVYDNFRTLALDSNNQYILAGCRRSHNNTPGFDSGVVTRVVNDSKGRYYNSIDGAVFYDNNYNGVQDAGEAIINNCEVAAIKPGTDTVPNWNSHGTFNLEVDTGSYTTSIKLAHPYFNSVPISKTTSHATYFNTDSVSFALQPLPGKRDISVTVSPAAPIARTNGYIVYNIFYQNLGTDTVSSGNVILLLDPVISHIHSTPLPDYFSGDTLRWNFTNLLPQEVRLIKVYCIFGSISMNQLICVQSKIAPLTGDLDTTNNTSTTCLTGLSAYDPNDKTEAHGGKIALSKATSGEYLTYTIRFQNTGNDTAFNVYIRDTIDNKLDWNSLQIVASSHNYKMTMNDGKCLFTFPFIMLVDSLHNKALSHGYIVYKIKAKPNVQLGDAIKNTAHIYFDYNLPITTNTEITTVMADMLPLKLLSFTAKKQGKTNLLQWTTANEINVDRFEVERSFDGRDFAKIGSVKATGADNYFYTDNTPTTTPNPKPQTTFYRLKMLDKDGQYTYSPVRLINNGGTFSVSVYPNPAKENLQLQIDAYKPSMLQAVVMSGDGRVVLSDNFAVSEGNSLRSITISALPAGTYFVKLTTTNGDKAEQVVKFEKL